MNRLNERYLKTIAPALRKRLGLSNMMQVPRLVKIVVNMGVGEAVANPKAIDGAVSDLTAITGQKPVVTRAAKSVATYKLRAGMQIGAKVTLRGERMYAFFDKLVNIVLPRIRDFRGMSRSSLDGRGNYALGLQRTISVSRNQLRQNRYGPWHGHRHRHDGAERRTSARVSR